MKRVLTLYYDSYEANYGDGFYPMLVRDTSCDSSIDVAFEYYDGELVQLSGPKIKGYDGSTHRDIIREMSSQ